MARQSSPRAVVQDAAPRRTAISIDGDLAQVSYDGERDLVLVELHDETGGTPRKLRFAPLEAERLAAELQSCHDDSNRAWRKAGS